MEATKDYTLGKLAYKAWRDSFEGKYSIRHVDEVSGQVSYREGTLPEFDKHETRIKDAWQNVAEAIRQDTALGRPVTAAEGN